MSKMKTEHGTEIEWYNDRKPERVWMKDRSLWWGEVEENKKKEMSTTWNMERPI